MKWISCEVTEGDFIPVQQRKRPLPKSLSAPAEDKSSESEDHVTSDEENEVTDSPQKPHLFVCPEDGCIKKYLTHGRLEQHIMYGKHKLKLERMTLLDRAKISYAEHLEAGSQTIISVSTKPTQTAKQKGKTPQKSSKGWALRESEKKYKRFSDKQKEYMEKKFIEGVKTGIKSSGEDVSKEMRFIRDENGNRIFSFDEFLRPQQITSFFSRMAAKRKKISEPDLEAETNHNDREKLCSDVLTALNRRPLKHPVLFSRQNLCAMEEKEFHELKMTQLRAITNHFDVKVKGRKKIDVVTSIVNFLERCQCKTG